MKRALVSAVMVAFCLSISQAVPVHAHEPFDVGPYRIFVGWIAEPVLTWQQNGVEVIVTNATDGLGIPGLASNLTITLSYAGQDKVFHGSAGQILTTEENGTYHAPVILTQAGSYNATVVGTIGSTPVTLHAFPDEFERVQDGYLGGDNGPMFPAAYPSPAALQTSINDANSRAMLIGYAGMALGVFGVALGLFALIRANRRLSSEKTK